jgi:hypothetical protein
MDCADGQPSALPLMHTHPDSSATPTIADYPKKQQQQEIKNIKSTKEQKQEHKNKNKN